MSEDLMTSLSLLAEQNPEGLTQADLRAFWESLDLPDAGYQRFEDAFRAVVDEGTTATLYFRPGGWVVKASGSVAKGAVTMALLTVALAASHATGIPLIVLPTILPMLIDLEKVRLTKGEEYILAQLTFTDAAREGAPDELYDRLPEAVKNDIGPGAFRDFLEKCRQAGLADRSDGPPGTGPDPQYSLRAPGSERFRVSFV